jgi:methionyl-tRNA formyltransferase
LKLAVAATAPLGAGVLARLAERHEIELVLTRPDRPRGRGLKTAAPPAKEVAERLGLRVEQPERLTEFPGEADVVVVAAYGVLVREDLLHERLWLNVHPSLLPRWRGAAPVERAIMAGDEKTGVSIIKLVRELDAGPLAAQEEFPVSIDDDAGAVYERAVSVAVDLLETEVLPEPRFVPQAEVGATYAEKITAPDRELDWSRPPLELHNRIRALSPHIGARGDLEGRRVIVWRSRLADGRLEILDVQPEGRRRMTYEEFLRGLR